MPGIFGAIGEVKGIQKRLTKSFESIWGSCETYSVRDGFLGAHAFFGQSALYAKSGDVHFVVDGESSLYRSASLFAEKGTPELFAISRDEISSSVDCKGNLAVFDQSKRALYLVTEWMGTFPLYYAEIDGAVFFSSHLKPLAKAVGAQPDPVGIIQFMRYAYTLAERTHFKGIKRLMPGQALVYKLDRKELRIIETSRAWTGQLVDEENIDLAIDRLWDCLKNAVQRCTFDEQQLALMSSAGWDSRLLFAALREQIDNDCFLGYSHGDIYSRELDITERIYKDAKIDCYLEQVNNDLYGLQNLGRGFERVENVIYPHWHRAGVRLSELGVESVTCGILGEVIGGHFNMNIGMTNLEKMRFVFSCFFKKDAFQNNKELSLIYDFTRKSEFEKPWYVDADFWSSVPDIKEEVNSDIEYTLKKIEDRGVIRADQLLEAYLAGYHGSRCGAAQLLSCRANLNISHVFADQELHLLSSRIPFSFKFYNSFNQALLRRYAPDLLQYPTAAMLVPAGAPILVQEATRMFRKISENLRLRVQTFSKGRVKPKHLGWDNFEFLRDGVVVKTLLDDLRMDVVDKNSMKKFVERIVEFDLNVPLYHLSDQFMKIYTTDLMLR